MLEKSQCCLVVLGMHRSGTSALAGALHISGIDLGKSIVKPSFDNPKGFFENITVQELNNDLLSELGYEWDYPGFLDNGWENLSLVKKYLSKAKEIIKSEFGSSANFCIKDPRICQLFPFWEKVLLDLKIDIKCVLALRHPDEITQSLRKRNNFTANKSQILIFTHLLNAVKYSRDYPTTYVKYESLLSDPQESIRRVYQLFDEEAELDNVANAELKKFLSTNLRHNKTDQEGIDISGGLSYLASTYDLLIELAEKNVIAPNDAKQLDKYWDTHHELTSSFYKGVVGKKEFFTKIFINSGNGYNEKETIIQAVDSNIHAWDLREFADFDKVYSFKFMPLNAPCIINVKDLGLGLNEKDDYIVTSNAYFIEDTTYYFDTPFPEIELDFSKPLFLEKLILSIEYIKTGEDVGIALKDLDYGRKISALNSEIDSKAKIIEERDNHIELNREEIDKLKNLVQLEQSKRNEEVKNLLADRKKMQLAIDAEIEDKNLVKKNMQLAIDAEIEDKNLVKKNMQLAIDAEIEDKNLLKKNMQLAIDAEIEDKRVIRESMQQALDHERQVREQTVSESRDLLFNELKDKEEKLNNLRNSIQHEINEKSKVVSELKEERNTVVSQLVSSVNHEIKERETVVQNMQKAIEHEKFEQVRMYNELAQSFSFKLGWFLTSPLRVIYNFFSGLSSGKIGLAFKMAGTAIRNPALTLQSINAEKIRTLKSALQRESPELIASNFKKLVKDEKAEESQIKANQAQQALFNKSESVIGRETQRVEASPVAAIGSLAPQALNGNHSEDQKNRSSSTAVLQTSITKKILFISPNIPDFDTSSGGKRATRMLGLLAEENDVYAYARGARQQKYIDKLSSLGVTFIEEYDYDKVKSAIPHLDVIIYAWYYTAHESAQFRDLYPDAKLIMDSVDIHWVREARSIGLMKGLTQEIADTNKKSEISAYKKGDVVWAVTEPDRQAVLEEIPDADVRVVSNIHDKALEEYYPTSKNNILFFGGYNHYPNISAVKIIAIEILPKIRVKIPDATLLIAGANAPKEVVSLGDLDGVVYLGFIEEEDVSTLYESSLVTVAPLLAGAGIKGKICEAIAFMTPVITNAIGNEGISLIDGVEGFVTEDFDTMVDRVVECMSGDHNLALMATNAQKKLHDIVGPEIVKKRMIDSLHREVSICIVTWNRLELLKPCIESIIAKTKYPHYKILVHSNGCEDGTQDYLRELAQKEPRLIPILSDKNDVFVIPNNQMAELYPHNDVVLINNDVTVEENWLQALVNAAYSSRKVGISGSKILYPDGTLQEFGSELYSNGSGRNIGKWEKDPYKEEFSKLTAVGYVSGCSLYAKRETIKRIGLFDMQFHPCYCEDSDLCYTAWKNDIYTLVTPHSIINHFEGGTSGKDEDSGFKSYQKVNFDKFLAKHKTDLDSIADKISKVNAELHQV